jgi:hypothetical protein
MSVMPKTRALIGDRGTTFTRSFANYALCCPSRATLYTRQYAHNHGVLSNGPPSGGYTRLDKSNWLPGWLQAAGYRTMHVGKFLNGYGVLSPPTEVPPGFNDWHGTVDPTTYRFYGYTVNENGTLRTYGAAGEPDFYSTDFLRPAGERVDRGGGAVPAAVLHVGRLRRAAQRSTGGARRSSKSCHPRAGAPTRERVLDRPASPRAVLERGRHFGQAGRRPAPGPDRRRPGRRDPGGLPAAARVAARCGRRGRVDSGGAPGGGRARRHARDLHERQRLLPRGTPDTDRQALAVRAVDPAAAVHAVPASPRAPCGASSSPTRTWRRRSSTPPTPAPAACRTAGRCSTCSRTRASNGGASS